MDFEKLDVLDFPDSGRGKKKSFLGRLRGESLPQENKPEAFGKEELSIWRKGMGMVGS